MGASGGGKTTLLHLLPRFADPTAGRITIDGVDLREATLTSLRAQMALVAQETFLFNDTVRANIAYGLTDVPQARLRGVAEAARAHGFISELPHGVRPTLVGERGVTRSPAGSGSASPSPGALLKDAPILLLDRGHLRAGHGERAEVSALDRLMEKRTCLVIAHRLSTIRHASRIAVLSGGRIAELQERLGSCSPGGASMRVSTHSSSPPKERDAG